MLKSGVGGQESGVRDFSETLSETGFAFVPASDMRALLEQTGPLSDWDAFAASWNDLKTDTYMADKSRYRKRRYAVYETDTNGAITRAPHQAHFQTLDYNPLHGGMERWFEPIETSIGSGSSMMAVLNFCRTLFDDLADGTVYSPPLEGGVGGGGHPLSPTSGLLNAPPLNLPLKGGGTRATLSGPQTPDHRLWHIETHQFRIEAQAGEAGQPTPEGLHRVGRDFVLVLLIRRENIQSGITSIHDLNKKPLGSFTLTQPFDAALVDDTKVYHGVTSVTPLDPAKPAYRDVLVVTFKAKEPQASQHPTPSNNRRTD